ncbi:uncharacterized protein BP01DRAFT_403101 [Aspergillus saccharolyticus JOP 1030-1]|uniref:Uncharacterized protein n=1 Tax=Aspergillus saccharolyticus JOP 1030-1 TaxID=1450539 RepID=A0A318ZHF4_9EURO|nr:hypothetical protein BP01DRAFT_403101 [Aspergillus saccharolyticus JOP 1030-1]PYH43120.1 hypothetical protein BP01DRAFT_403101 [Aspergillus saccharolyticus JOP 1030-1]
MQCTRSSGSSTPMGRDPDARWVQWLALTRRNNPASLSSGALSPSSLSTASQPMACSNLNNSGGGRVRSRSSATSYFALLSAAEDAHQHQHQHHKQQYYHGGATPVPTSRHLDSSWVAWLNDRQQQRQGGSALGDASAAAAAAASGTVGPQQQQQQYCYNPGLGRSPSEPPMHGSSQDSNGTIMPSAFFNTTSAFSTATTATTGPPSMISSAATPFLSPLAAPLTDAEIDALSQQFPDLSADGFLPTGFPAEGVPMHDEEMMMMMDQGGGGGPFDPAELDAGLLTWLDEQHAFAFNDRLGGGGEDALAVPVAVGVAGGSPTTSKRGLSLDVYPGEISAEGTGWEGATKKQRVYSS